MVVVNTTHYMSELAYVPRAVFSARGAHTARGVYTARSVHTARGVHTQQLIRELESVETVSATYTDSHNATAGNGKVCSTKVREGPGCLPPDAQTPRDHVRRECGPELRRPTALWVRLARV